ncbi:universal stress protein [Natrarchaeobaculum aegyptiacum]|uniref:Universal stress protein UspA n=1 Tax=Natrarchaeobaculum aegyptiacum TaxID=745377 RepID=A0A2Z2HR32_9EURY|nr:universal stress protein [Natrarchaeobaculum aegyptiacum]ARS88495.1 universal stress protein UspA [Natrarchaeobaculum aegyptiacum]
MYRVLVPIDEHEDRAQAQLDAVLDLPDVTESVAVELLHVRKELEFSDADDVQIGEVKTNREEFDDLPALVGDARSRLEEGGVETAVHSATGNPPAAILDLAEEFDVDELILGTRRKSPVGKVLFGSVTQAVILDSDRPVKVVSP